MATIQYVVNAVDAASATFARIAGSADEVLLKLDEIGKKSATARVALAGDKEASLSIDKLDLKMANLGKRVATGKIGVEGQARALTEIRRLELELDKVGAKHVTATVDVKVNNNALQRLLVSGLGGGGGGGGGGAGGGGAGLAALAGGAGGLGLIGAGLVPGVVGLGLGGAVGLGGAAAALALAQKAGTTLAADQKAVNALQAQLAKAQLSLKNASTAASRQSAQLRISQIQGQLGPAQDKLSTAKGIYGPFAPLGDVLPGLEKQLTGALAPIVGQQSTLTKGGPGGHPLFTPATGLVAIFNQLATALQKLSPLITQLFKASLPFVSAFVSVLGQAGKILLPAFTGALQQMVKSGALKQMTDALVVITKGLATFIVNLGPGMAASAQIFARVATFLGQTLGFLGDAFTVIAKVLAFDVPKAARDGVDILITVFNILKTRTVAVFDAIRGVITTVWDTVWRNTVTRAQNGIAAVVNGFRSFLRLIGGVLTSLRSVISGAWNTIWVNTATRVQAGINTVIGFFRALPGRVVNALTGLGHTLGSFAAAALNEMWNGFKRIGGSITSWFTGFGKSIISVVKKVLGVFSPSSVFFDIGVNLMKGLENGVKHGVGAAQAAAQAAAHRVANVGSGVQRWAPLVRQALAMEGLSPGLLRNVLYQMSTESGGNPNAINNTDINARNGQNSRGLMQVIPPTFAAYHWPGTSNNIYNPLANIAAALNYARHVYGPSLMSGGQGIGSGHGYDSGGWLPTGASIAYNNTGQPEQVLAPGSLARVEMLLVQILAATRVAPAATSAGTARALNSAARSAMGAR